MNKRHVGLSLLISAVILFGGCYGMIADDPSGEIDNSTDAKTGSELNPANPYEKETLVVAIDETNAERETAPMVREALDYWEANAEEHAGYPIAYDLQPNATDPDVQITWVEEVNTCELSYDSRLLGCADIPDERAPETASVTVETGLVRNDTVELLKHELGHTLGLDHDDEPAGLMAGEMNATPRETHVDVQVVWETDSHDRDDVLEQVEHAFTYFASWSETNMETNVTYDLNASETRTPDHDFYIEVADDREHCDANETISCTEFTGESIQNGSYTVGYADIREDAVGWYTGYYIGAYLSLEESETPAVFQNTETDHVLGEWWEGEP